MPKVDKRCCIPDCGKRHKASGYCEKHWDRIKKYGVPELPKKERKACAIEGCGKQSMSRGLCSIHYQRLMSHGDASYKPLSRQMDEFIQSALDSDTDKCVIWPFKLTSHGYASIKRSFSGRKKHVLVNRLICEQFRGPPPSSIHQAAHECGVAACCNPRHISWKTPAGNIADREIHGTNCKGERNGSAKLSAAEALEILTLRGARPTADIARQFSITTAMVCRIHRRAAWRHLTLPS